MDKIRTGSGRWRGLSNRHISQERSEEVAEASNTRIEVGRGQKGLWSLLLAAAMRLKSSIC